MKSKDRFVGFRITEEQFEKLMRLAEKHNMRNENTGKFSISEPIRWLIDQYQEGEDDGDQT